MEAWRAELYHHGIKGQRWGVQKGPPYPLDPKDHTAAEKKAGWRQSLGEQSKRVARKLKDNVSSLKQRVSSTRDTEIGENEEKSKRMSPQAKKVLATTAAVAALGVIGAVAIKNPKVRELAANGMKTAANLLEKSADVKVDEFDNFMNQMAKEDAVREKRLKSAFERERKAAKKEQEQLWKEMDRARAKAKRERIQKEIANKIETMKFNAATNRMLLEDELRRRQYANVSSAELLSRARRSKYTR